MAKSAKPASLTDIENGYIKRTRELRLRVRPKIGPRRMAMLLGCGYEAYRQYEKRTPMPPVYIDRFCTIVGGSIEYLLTGRRGERSPEPAPSHAGEA